MRTITPISFCLIMIAATAVSAQELPPPSGIEVPVFADPILSVDFDDHLREWDGFGVTYVETAQTRDYEAWPQEYGGFSLLSNEERGEILDLIFGEDGLRPSLTKLFLDVWHEPTNDNDDPYSLDRDAFDHERTTRWLRYFNREGLRRVRAWGGDLTMLTTLYGPPAWATEQGFILGRDIDPAHYEEVAEYVAAWVKYLREEEGFPVRYASFHNEGGAYYRWPRDASNPGEDRRDYNALWRPETVVELLKITPTVFAAHGLEDEVGLTPGETQTWYRFDAWGYARAIAHDREALMNLDLITSHSFANYTIPQSVYYGDWRSNGTDLLRDLKPGLHAWVTSMSWGDVVTTDFVDDIRRNIYMSKVNGLIPWALIERSGQWIGGDPNPATAFRVDDDSTYTVLPGYYFYKQVARAGQPDMAVAAVISLDPAVGLIAFASNGTDHPDAFVVVNTDDVEKETAIDVRGTPHTRFQAFRTTDGDGGDRYRDLGSFGREGDRLMYTAPPRSVTTFFGQ